MTKIDFVAYFKELRHNINSETANWKLFSDILKGASIYE